jgi:hypothetical protein
VGRPGQRRPLYRTCSPEQSRSLPAAKGKKRHPCRGVPSRAHLQLRAAQGVAQELDQVRVHEVRERPLRLLVQRGGAAWRILACMASACR